MGDRPVEEVGVSSCQDEEVIYVWIPFANASGAVIVIRKCQIIFGLLLRLLGDYESATDLSLLSDRQTQVLEYHLVALETVVTNQAVNDIQNRGVIAYKAETLVSCILDILLYGMAVIALKIPGKFMRACVRGGVSESVPLNAICGHMYITLSAHERTQTYGPNTYAKGRCRSGQTTNHVITRS